MRFSHNKNHILPHIKMLYYRNIEYCLVLFIHYLYSCLISKIMYTFKLKYKYYKGTNQLLK